MAAPTPRKGGLLKRLSYKIADADTKLERICVVTGNVEKLKALTKKKKDLYTTLLDGWTPLQVSAFNLHEGVVLHLLAQVGSTGSNPNAVEAEGGCSVLHMLAWRGALGLVRAVVETGNAGLNTRSQVGVWGYRGIRIYIIRVSLCCVLQPSCLSCLSVCLCV
jgi:hypothetical protein